jgi:hypothetical protein
MRLRTGIPETVCLVVIALSVVGTISAFVTDLQRCASATAKIILRSAELTVVIVRSLRKQAPIIAASRTPPWLASGWGCRGRRLSRGQKSSGGLATAAARLCAPVQQTVGRNVWDRVRSQSSNPAATSRALVKQC